MRNTAAFKVTTALSAAFAFLPKAWGGAGLALLLLWAATVGGPYLLTHYCAPLLCLALLAAVALLKLISLGALYRAALFGKDARKEGLGPGGLQFGLPELRLLTATVVAGLFVAMIAGAAFVVFAIMMKIYGLDLSQRPSGVLLAAMAAAPLLLLFVLLKFSLLHAANVAQRKLVTLNALGLTSGNVGKLFLGIVVLTGPFALAGAILLHLFAPELRLAHALPYPWLNQRLNLIVHGGMMFLSIGVLLPLLTGFFASAYRQITVFRAG